MKMLCVDPGSSPWGWCLWDGMKLKRYGTERSNARSYHERSFECANQLRDVVRHTEPDKVIIELPKYMPGHAAAAGGNLVKLCFTVGRMMQVCDEIGIFIVTVDPDWLGQLNDAAIRYRVEHVLGREHTQQIKAHAIDAVAMGLYVLGKWPG